MKYATPRHTTFNGQRTGKRFALNRRLLPGTLDYLTARGFKLKGRGQWRDMLCPFHDDHTASLRIHSLKGCFKCMACGAKGGDLIAFHQRLTGRSFIDTCKDLGAWEEQA